MNTQKTLKETIHLVGIGLHSGKEVNLVLRPARPNTGLVFVRTDLDDVEIPAALSSIDFRALQLATTLRKGNAVVQTTEHLLSALYAMGVDNAYIELDGPEVPIMDGSAQPFIAALEATGVREQAAVRQVLEITTPFSFEHQGKTIEARPARDYRISYEINFDHPEIQTQRKTVVVDAQYEKEVATARTFGFLKDVTYLQSIGLCQGGSMDNAVVLDENRILNDEGLRSADEFVSHKILDMIGDFAVAGYRFRGHFQAHKAGHEVHALFLRELLASDCYRVVAVQEETYLPVRAVAIPA